MIKGAFLVVIKNGLGKLISETSGKNQPPGNSKDNVAGNDTSEGRFNQVLAFGRQFLCSKNALYMVFNYLSTIEN